VVNKICWSNPYLHRIQTTHCRTRGNVFSACTTITHIVNSGDIFVLRTPRLWTPCRIRKYPVQPTRLYRINQALTVKNPTTPQGEESVETHCLVRIQQKQLKTLYRVGCRKIQIRNSNNFSFKKIATDNKVTLLHRALSSAWQNVPLAGLVTLRSIRRSILSRVCCSKHHPQDDAATSPSGRKRLRKNGISRRQGKAQGSNP